MSFLSIIDLLIRCGLSCGTLYVAYRLFRLWRDLPDAERLLKKGHKFNQIQATTIQRFRSVGLVPLGIGMQGVYLLLLWVGWLTDQGLFTSVTSWLSMTLAAGCTPLIVLHHGMQEADKLRIREQIREHILGLISDGIHPFSEDIMPVFGVGGGDVMQAKRSLEEDGLIEGGHFTGYSLTEDGKGLQQIRSAIATIGTSK
ncbi:hypothetical protein N9917_04840 [Deltaproteobacteria bacterium]|nr:hypothetical protein [Deltaproteobacteria bacterium]